MLVLTLGFSPWVASLLVAVFLLICLLLILIVLIQRPQGGGLGGAFGAGGGSGQTAFGAKTGDALTIATIGIFVMYLLVAIGLQFVARPSSVVQQPTAIGTTGEPSEPVDQTPVEPEGIVPPGQIPADGDPQTPAEDIEDAPLDPVDGLPSDVEPSDDGTGGGASPDGG